MLNKILLALFILFILTLLGWCSPQCSHQPTTTATNALSSDTIATVSSGATAAGSAMVETSAGADSSAQESPGQMSEIAAEAASTTLDLSEAQQDSVAEIVEETHIVTTETSATQSVEPAPRPEDFVAATTDVPADVMPSATRESPDTAATSDAKTITAEADKISAALTNNSATGSKTANVVLKGVNFETNSDQLTTDSVTLLDLVADDLQKHPDINVEIAGYTDNTGDPAYNIALSQRRAKAVVDYLSTQGIDPTRLSAKGYGAESPIADNATPAGRKRNRRVEMQVK